MSGTTFYAATKAAVSVMTRRFAMDLGPHGVTVNAVAPGFILTDMARDGKNSDDIPVAPPKRAGDEGGAGNLRGEPQPFTASLDQGNPCVREHLRQPAGNDATSSTRPDDNVISARRGRTVSRSQPALRRRDLEADMVVRPAPSGQSEFDTAHLGNHLGLPMGPRQTTAIVIEQSGS
jgi:hypothetical protein